MNRSRSAVSEPIRAAMTIGNDQRGVGAKQRPDLRLIGLKLMVRSVDRRILIAGVLQLDDGEREAIDEDDDIGPPVGVILDHRELVDYEPVVSVRVVEVDQPRLLAADGAIRPPHLDRHALDEVAMQPPVLGGQRRRLRISDFGEYVSASFKCEVRVQPLYRRAQTVDQEHIAVVCALRRPSVGADLNAVDRRVAEFREPSEGGLLNVAFSKTRHGFRLPIPIIPESSSSGAKTSCSRAS